MSTYTITGSFGWAGGGKSGAIVDAWATSRFGGPPAENQAPPSGNPDAGPVTTGENFGNPGAFIIDNVAVLQDYYIRVQYGEQTYWGVRTAGQLGGLGGGGDVLTVFGRTGNIVAQTGDYTAAEVGADTAGSAAAAQANAQGYTNGAIITAVETAEAFATTAANNAEAAAKAASLPLTGGTLSGSLSLGDNPIVGVSALGVTGLTGATAISGYVGGTSSGAPVSGTFTTGDFVVDQSGTIWVCSAGGTPGTWHSPLASPALTGTPTAPTATPLTDNTRIATTAYTDAAVAAAAFPSGAWTSFTPTWASSGTSPAIGNGSLVGAYQKIGRQVAVRISIVAGSTTTFGTGNYAFTLPFQGAANAGQVLTCTFNDNTNLWTGAGIIAGSGGQVTPYTTDGGTSGSMVVFTNTQFTGSGQGLNIQGVYESLT